LGRGDVAGATLSATSMLPIVGDAIGKGGKIARAAIKHGDEVLEVEKWQCYGKLWQCLAKYVMMNLREK
ncbi:MAG: hypothetical protein UIH41_11570, partial [Treponemataceae bacterium]|nr:hypothetical protein [Treponemataceae bacterium]